MKELLREAAAEFLARESNRQSLITVTEATITEDGREGRIFITVYPDSAEEGALQFANRNRAEFAHYFTKRVKGMRAPHVEFMIDRGEKNRQRLDELSN